MDRCLRHASGALAAPRSLLARENA